MKNEPKKSSGIPVIIIILVFAGMIFGGWWLYSSSQPSGNTNTAGSPTPRNSQIPTNAPIGANPPQMLGSPTASVTVEEFADFQCGSCAATHPVLKEVQSTYGSKIKFVFRHFPLQIHDKAYDAAVAAEAAGMQGKFWALQDQLFSNQQSWTGNPNFKQMWAEYASKVGLDVPRWENDMIGIAAKTRVDQDLARGRALGVGSTPTVYVNGQSVPYPEMNAGGMRRIIDAELQKLSSSQAQPAAPANPAPASNANTPK